MHAMYGSVDVCLRDVNGWDIGFAMGRASGWQFLAFMFMSVYVEITVAKVTMMVMIRTVAMMAAEEEETTVTTVAAVRTCTVLHDGCPRV